MFHPTDELTRCTDQSRTVLAVSHKQRGARQAVDSFLIIHSFMVCRSVGFRGPYAPSAGRLSRLGKPTPISGQLGFEPTDPRAGEPLSRQHFRDRPRITHSAQSRTSNSEQLDTRADGIDNVGMILQRTAVDQRLRSGEIVFTQTVRPVGGGNAIYVCDRPQIGVGEQVVSIDFEAGPSRRPCQCTSAGGDNRQTSDVWVLHR
jgi:hypothetical protein